MPHFVAISVEVYLPTPETITRSLTILFVDEIGTFPKTEFMTMKQPNALPTEEPGNTTSLLEQSWVSVSTSALWND